METPQNNQSDELSFFDKLKIGSMVLGAIALIGSVVWFFILLDIQVQEEKISAFNNDKSLVCKSGLTSDAKLVSKKNGWEFDGVRFIKGENFYETSQCTQ